MAHAEVKHDYQLLPPSPWPAVGSLSAFTLAIGAIIAMKGFAGPKATGFIEFLFAKGHPWILYLGFLMVAFTMFSWWRDVIEESIAGEHTPVVQLSFRYGMILFIASEVMFFVAWFWAYFSPALFPGGAVEVARAAYTHGVWPPKGIENSGSVGCSAHQHLDPFDLGHDGHLGASRHSERQPQGPHLGLVAHRSPRHELHGAAGT